MDFILNGNATGPVAGRLIQNGFDPHCMRPYLDAQGRSCITVMNNGKPTKMVVANADAVLRKDDWLTIDRAIVKVAKPRLKAFGDLRGAGLSYTIPNGMSKTVLETEVISDITPAQISMDGITEGDNDRPAFDLLNLPLPIIHKDFNYTARQVMASRNGGSPLDTSSAELAARRVAETVEQMTIGTLQNYSFGGGTIYGYTNFPNRITTSITQPTTTNQQTTVNELLAMKRAAFAASQFGPFNVYCGLDWDPYMDGDYSDQYGGKTLRQRIGDINGFTEPMTLDYLPGYDLILVQQTSDTARAVVGMDITTLQWETKGGMQLNFKVMAILVPQLRADYNGQCGIVHGTV